MLLNTIELDLNNIPLGINEFSFFNSYYSFKNIKNTLRRRKKQNIHIHRQKKIKQVPTICMDRVKWVGQTDNYVSKIKYLFLSNLISSSFQQTILNNYALLAAEYFLDWYFQGFMRHDTTGHISNLISSLNPSCIVILPMRTFSSTSRNPTVIIKAGDGVNFCVADC